MTRRASVLVTMPNYDLGTRYLSAWAKKFIDDISSKGTDVYKLEAEKATKARMISMIRKMKPELVFLNGHGSQTLVLGHNHKVVLDESNISVMKGAIIYALACSSLKKLGERAVAVGAMAYVGYAQEFIMFSNKRYFDRPMDDPTAALFLDPSIAVATSLAKGHTAEEAVARGRAEFNKSIDAALNSDVQSDDDKFIPYLMWNRNFLGHHSTTE